jgi:hypothetical protein
VSHMEKWTEYMNARRGTYEFRCRTRYKGVADRLFKMGLHGDSVMDVGSGSGQFGTYLRSRGWQGKYIPVDAVLDGTDLETWTAPLMSVGFCVCIEVIEHLQNPHRLISQMFWAAQRGLVLTTPNHEVVDVLRCDPTHVSVIPAQDLEDAAFTVERHSWFHEQDNPGQLDTLLAWRAL